MPNYSRNLSEQICRIKFTSYKSCNKFQSLACPLMKYIKISINYYNFKVIIVEFSHEQSIQERTGADTLYRRMTQEIFIYFCLNCDNKHFFDRIHIICLSIASINILTSDF